MKTYRLLLAILITIGIPTYLSYMAYKATMATVPTDLTLPIFVAGMAWIIAIIIVVATFGDTLTTYLMEH